MDSSDADSSGGGISPAAAATAGDSQEASAAATALLAPLPPGVSTVPQESILVFAAAAWLCEPTPCSIYSVIAHFWLNIVASDICQKDPTPNLPSLPLQGGRRRRRGRLNAARVSAAGRALTPTPATAPCAGQAATRRPPSRPPAPPARQGHTQAAGAPRTAATASQVHRRKNRP